MGHYQSRAGAYSCDACASGTFTAALGSVACSSCGVGTDSNEGAVACTLSASDYYLDPQSGEVLACPSNSRCLGGDEMPRPAVGFWVNRNRLGYAGGIFACSRNTCKGAVDMSVGAAAALSGGSRRLSSATGLTANTSCWARAAYNDSAWQERVPDFHGCDANLLLCTEGAYGPICGRYFSLLFFFVRGRKKYHRV